MKAKKCGARYTNQEHAEEANCREMKKIEATLEERDVYFSGTAYFVMVSAG